MGLFDGERALITGAASNIGREIAIAIAHEGATVQLVDINGDAIANVAGALNAQGDGTATVITADLSTREGWKPVADAMTTAPVDMFVHSASPPRREADTVAQVSEDTFDAMVNTNLRSGFFLSRAAAAAMQRDGMAGRILLVTSMHKDSPRNLPHYSASKAGMTMLIKELARHYGPDGIRVNGLAPGAVPGGGFNPAGGVEAFASRIAMRRVGNAAETARSAVALMSNDLCGYVTGTTLEVDGGIDLFNWIDPPV